MHSFLAIKRSARDLVNDVSGRPWAMAEQTPSARPTTAQTQRIVEHEQETPRRYKHKRLNSRREYLRDLFGGRPSTGHLPIGTTTATAVGTVVEEGSTTSGLGGQLYEAKSMPRQVQNADFWAHQIIYPSPPTVHTPGSRPSTRNSPRSLSRSGVDKPLPSPPTRGTLDKSEVHGRVKNSTPITSSSSSSTKHNPKPALKLQRIMATLSQGEIEKLFSGAPQFFARSQGLGTGPPHPSVAFPWDEELVIRDLTDHAQIEDDAWGNVTAGPRIILRDPTTPISSTGRSRAHFDIRCQERPNMLSMQGLEKGTMGYQAALEWPVADALEEEQYGFDSFGSKNPVIMERRKGLIISKDKLRHLDDAAIMEQLMKCEHRYAEDRSTQSLTSQQLYDELFRKILYPPTRVIDRHDPFSLSVQIYALVKILALPNTWIDFSRVEWRIRLGHILWGGSSSDEPDDVGSPHDGIDVHERSEERYWLLLQILLACELLIRLNAITEGDEIGGAHVRVSEIHKFEKEANQSTKWSLLLARTWMDNISVSKTEAPRSGTSTPKGWLTALTSRMSTFKHDHMHGTHNDHVHLHPTSQEHTYTIKGRHTERQVYGLTQFARKLRWPDIETYVTRVSINSPAMAEATPINTPLPTSDSQRSSYFGNVMPPTQVSRQLQRRRKLEAALHLSGWLSKSYCSGLVLPGEALSHFLMSTLLENDPDAMAKLGPMANLCGGFVYSGKSFWSTSCIVGRVLAAGQGSAECMGWVSSDLVPEGLGDGWVNVKVEEIADDFSKTGKKARIWGKKNIERESDVLGDVEPSDVLPADFIIPHENHYSQPPPSNIRIEFKSLHLFAPVDSARSTPLSEKSSAFSDSSSIPEIYTYPASLSFSLTHDGLRQEQLQNFALSKDANFVTAHPCSPSSYVKLYKSPTSPTIQQIDVAGHDWAGKNSSPAHITGHPLHKYFTYKAIHLVELLQRPDARLEDLIGSGTSSPHSNGYSAARAPRILVIDCITGFTPPRSPGLDSLSRVSSLSSSFGLEQPAPPQIQLPTHARNKGVPTVSTASSSTGGRATRVDPPPPPTAESKMRLGTRKRNFGSDLEIFVRALCAERGWNALISRRRRGCLACAIREAGALGWKVIIRVD